MYMIRYFMQYDYSLLFLSRGVVLLIEIITLHEISRPEY